MRPVGGSCAAPYAQACHQRPDDGQADPRPTWAELLERGTLFAEDVLRCPDCGGRRRRIAIVNDPLGLAPARPPPQVALTFG